jgi:hypothetical protein
LRRFVPSSGRLYAAPSTADAVLIINPVTNTTDITTIDGLTRSATGGEQSKWSGFCYVPSTGKIYATPIGAVAVLIIDPRTNASDYQFGIRVPNGPNKWVGSCTWAPNTGRLYFAPLNAGTILVVDPITNGTSYPWPTFWDVQRGTAAGMLWAPNSGKFE